MTDDKMSQNAKDARESTKPEQDQQQEQQGKVLTTAQPDHRPSPSRKPLFRS